MLAGDAIFSFHSRIFYYFISFIHFHAKARPYTIYNNNHLQGTQNKTKNYQFQLYNINYLINQVLVSLEATF